MAKLLYISVTPEIRSFVTLHSNVMQDTKQHGQDGGEIMNPDVLFLFTTKSIIFCVGCTSEDC